MTMGVPGKLKSFFDRFRVFFMAKYVRKQSFFTAEQRARRKAFVICISGMDIPEVFVGAKLTISAFLTIIDCKLRDELLISGMDTKGDLRTQPDLLEAAYAKGFALGKTLNP
jgi:hypothetical protein